MATAGQIKGITVKIEGDTNGLAKDLASVNKQISKTSSALRDVEKALELDPTNVELLEQKQALLSKKIEETEQKLQLEQQAAEKAREALELGSITQEEYATLQAEITKTESSLNQLKAAADGTGDSLDETGDNVEEAGDKAEESSEKWENFGQAAKVAAEVAAAAITAVAAAATAAGAALINCSVEGAAFADEILTMSTVTGVSTETLQEWSYAAELVDVSVDTMTSALTKTTKAIGQAANGSESAIASFDALGVSFTNADGSMKDSEEVFYDIIDALGNVENETERDVIAMDLLGKSAQELNPLIEAGADTLEELGEQAHEAGYVLDDETLGAFGEFDDQLQKLQSGTQAAKNALGTVLLPVLTSLAGDGVDLLGQFSSAVLDADGDIDQIGGIVSEMLPQILDTVLSYLPMLVELAGSIIEAVGQGLIDNLDIILESALEIVFALCDGVLSMLPELASVAIDLTLSLAEYLISNLPTIISTGIDILLALVDGITSSLDDLIPVCIEAILTITTALLERAPDIIESGISLIGSLASGLLDNLPEVVSACFSIIETLLSTLADAGPDIIDQALSWGKDLIDSFVSGIAEALPNLVSGLTDVAETVASYLHFTSPDVGPLAHDLIGKSGADMIDTFAQGMSKEDDTLNRALNQTATIIAQGMTGQDYSGQLGSISAQLASMGGSSAPSVINVYLGSTKLGSVLVGATTQENYRAGGL